MGRCPFRHPDPRSATWGANGALLTDTPLTPFRVPAAPPLGPIGSPSGSTFSIWQPGQAALVLSPLGRYEIHIPGAYTYSTDFATWSPDGKLLWDSLGNPSYLNYLRGYLRVEPAGHPLPSAQTLRAFGLTQASLLPVRDAGLQAIYDAMKTTAPDNADAGAQTAQLAWRPDGRYVAAQLALFAYPPPTDISLRAVSVYDCATGTVAATLTPPQPKREPGISNANMLRWSPDGAHLLLLDRSLQEALVWSGSSLPK